MFASIALEDLQKLQCMLACACMLIWMLIQRQHEQIKGLCSWGMWLLILVVLYYLPWAEILQAAIKAGGNAILQSLTGQLTGLNPGHASTAAATASTPQPHNI